MTIKERIREYRNYDKKQLEKKLYELRIQLMKTRMEIRGSGAAPSRASPTKKINQIKKEMARIKTILNEK